MGSLEAWEAHDMNRKGNEIDHANQGILDGSSDSGSRIGHKRLAKADMGAHG